MSAPLQRLSIFLAALSLIAIWLLIDAHTVGAQTRGHQVYMPHHVRIGTPTPTPTNVLPPPLLQPKTPTPSPTATPIPTATATPESPAAQTCGGTLSYGDSRIFANHAGWPHCDYWFEAYDGDRVTITVEVLEGNLEPLILLYDHAAQVLAQGDWAIWQHALPRGAGLYGFRVTSAGDAEAGNVRSYGAFRVTLFRESTYGPNPAAGNFVQLDDAAFRPYCGNAERTESAFYTYVVNRSPRLIAVDLRTRIKGEDGALVPIEFPLFLAPQSCLQLGELTPQTFSIVKASYLD